MERVTKRAENGKAYMVESFESLTTGIWIAIDKLADYEDAEEQGLLLRLPCEYKTKVYVVPTNENGLRDIAEMLCLGYSIGEPQNNMNLFSTNRFNKNVPKMYQPSIDEFGKTVFLAKEQAEKKLESMKGE